ncbi:MAG: ribonuclease HII [Syntrophomonadaceae bacterium]|jgi:ribonuclease HII|nr:ribonuclease HII [Syntrophomonadaceae bacterium]
MNQKVKVPASEIERLHAMTSYERNLFAAGVQYIAGIDEAGRGPIAGPVVAAAVILPRDFFVPEVDDSKRLKPSLREKLSLAIKRQALDWSIGIVSVSCLDQINIYQATKLAMITACNNLRLRAEHLIIDAVKLPELSIPQTSLIKGDSLSLTVACASILAKVERDEIMEGYDKLFPGYGFAKHKGYATREHIEALFRLGPCPVHRTSFEPVKSWPGEIDYAGQL